MVEHFESVQDIYRLADEARELTWLEVDMSEPLWDESTKTSRVFKKVRTGSLFAVKPRIVADSFRSQSEWTGVLPGFPNLRAFHGVSFLEDPDFPNENEERLALLGHLLPQLEQFDHWEEDSDQVVVLVRDGESVEWSTRKDRCRPRLQKPRVYPSLGQQ